MEARQQESESTLHRKQHCVNHGERAAFWEGDRFRRRSTPGRHDLPLWSKAAVAGSFHFPGTRIY